MSADYSTELKAEGSRQACENIMALFRVYGEEQRDQYHKKHDCWYMQSVRYTMKPVEEGSDRFLLDVYCAGPYGVWRDVAASELNIFPTVAEAAPDCSFTGSLSGWDAGEETYITAELKDGLLHVKAYSRAFDLDCYEDEEIEDEEAEDENTAEDGEEDSLVSEKHIYSDFVYDPVARKYV